MSFMDTSKELTILKKQPETCWLADVSSVVLQQSLQHLDAAFQNFFAKRGQYPAFKSKRNTVLSASFIRRAFTLMPGKDGNIVLSLARIKEPMKVNWSRNLPSLDPSRATVTKDAAGRYFVSLLFEEDIPALPKTGNQIALNLESENLVIPNEVASVSIMEHSLIKQKRLARYQRRLGRKLEASKESIGFKGKPIPKGINLPKSNNYKKTVLKISKMREKIKDSRSDFLQKLSTTIVRENQVVVVKGLNATSNIQNKNHAKSIYDVSWAKFCTMLEYKCAWYGRTFVAK